MPFAEIFFSDSTRRSPFLIRPAFSSSSGVAACTPLRTCAVFASSESTRPEMSFGKAADRLSGSIGMPMRLSFVLNGSPLS